MSNNLSIIILAAGKGTRMKSDLPKVMHKVAGREMLNMVIDEAKKLNPYEIIIVISEDFAPFQNKIFKQHEDVKISFALQKERKGTAHAVKIGLEKIEKQTQKILVLYGDTPLIEEKTLHKMLSKIDSSMLCVLGFDCFAQNAYGRLVTDVNNDLEAIVEYKDATIKEREITLCNSGVMAIRGEIVNLLNEIDNNNANHEFYLTDLVKIARKHDLNCSFIQTLENEVLGVNSRFELANIENIKQNKLRRKHMDAGVTLLDPYSVYFSYDTKIAHDVIIYPQVYFGKNVVIEKDVKINGFCFIEDSIISASASIGPFARLRGDVKIGQEVKIGNFVEVKKSNLKKGVKASHLSYIGDSEIGQDSNIGAGVITCNYDGYNKYTTQIEENVFIGSNSALVAPVRIGKGAVIGAGSVITENVVEDELAVARSQQINIPRGAARYHASKSKK